MSTFTLIVQPDGHAVLTTERQLSPGEAEAVRAAFVEWRDGIGATLIVPECDVVQVIDVELRVREPVGL